MSGERKAWKVFSNINGELFSAIVTGHAQKHYRLDHWNRAPRWLAQSGYYLFCFSTRSAARRYVHGLEDINHHLVVRQVRVRGVADLLPEFLDPQGISAGQRIHLVPLPWWGWPDGTIMACEVYVPRARRRSAVVNQRNRGA